MFRDRTESGQKLARALQRYKNRSVQVLAIPHGGVRVGYEVASSLDSDFSILIACKLPFPENPESGFGAVAEDGSTVILNEAVPYLSKVVIQDIIDRQKKEVSRRISTLRGNAPLPAIRDRVVILIDDGIAMGSTMRAAIRLCRKCSPSAIVVAVPVAAPEVRRRLARIVDEIVVLETPSHFQAVAQVYSRWYDVPDREVIDILHRWENRNRKV